MNSRAWIIIDEISGEVYGPDGWAELVPGADAFLFESKELAEAFYRKHVAFRLGAAFARVVSGITKKV